MTGVPVEPEVLDIEIAPLDSLTWGDIDVILHPGQSDLAAMLRFVKRVVVKPAWQEIPTNRFADVYAAVLEAYQQRSKRANLG